MKLPNFGAMPILGGGLASIAYGFLDKSDNTFPEIALVFLLSTIVFTLLAILDELKEAKK